MRFKLPIRLLSLFLTVALVLQLVPTVSFAAEAEPVSTAVEVAPGEAGKTVLGEVTENREQTQKHFRLDDGSFLAVDYGLAVHYAEEDGSWEDIDNTLILQGSTDSNAATASTYSSGTSLSGGQYVAENGEDTKAFASDLSSGFLFAAHTSELGVSMSLASSAPSLDDPITMDEEATLQGGHNQFATAQITYPDDSAETQGDASLLSWLFPEETEEPSLLEQAIPTRLRAEVLYEDVYDGIDLLYELYGGNVKETIRVNYAQSDYTYSFRMETEGLVPSLQEDGSVYLADSNGEVLYCIPAPYMTDANEAYSEDVYYTLSQVGTSWILTVTANADWINASERVFPVDIDPTLIDTTKTNEFTGYICNQDNETVSATTNLACGYHPDHGQMEIYYKLTNMPDIPAGCTLVNAQAGLYQNDFRSGTNSTSGQIVLYMSQIMTATDFSSAIAWENRPAIGDVLDYTLARHNTIGSILTWDITAAAKNWYASEGATNYGLAMTSNSDSTSKTRAWFNYSHDLLFAVTYRSTTGLEGYYTYQTAGAGNAGISSISDFTGQLTQTMPITSYASAVNPFSLELYYNSGYCTYYGNTAYSAGLQQNLDMILGAGVSMNIMQYITKVEVQNDITNSGKTQYLRLTDGDGTWHYFAKDSDRQSKYYYDEDGMGLKIWEYATGCYKVYEHDGEDTQTKDNEDPADYRMLFINGHLREMQDQNGNIIRINYQNGDPTANDDLIMSVDQVNKGGSAIRVATFTYSSNDILQTITDAAGFVYTLTVDNRVLTQISRNGTVIAQYTYDGKRMTSAYDAEAKQGISFTYTDGKLSSYHEYAVSNGVTYEGNKVQITYPGNAQTTYRDLGADHTANTEDDILTSYLFNYAGRSVNAYTTDNKNKVLGASNAVYSGTGTTDMTNNRTLRTASIGVAAMNELHDHGFEALSTDWSFSGITSGATNIVVKAMTGSDELVRTGTNACKGWIKPGNTSTIGVSRSTYRLYAGTAYTLSAYVNTSKCTNFAGTGLYLQAKSGTTTYTSEKLNYQTDTSIDGGWVRLSLTFTPNTTGIYTVSLYNHGAGPYFYTDDWQLEANETPSNLNLLENGNLQYWNYGWTCPTITTGGYTYHLAEFHPGEGLFSQDENAFSLRTYGDAYTNNHAYQDVAINQTGGSYVLSGWAKATAVPDNVQDSDATAETDLNKQFGLRAMITYSDNSTEYHYAPFCSDVKEWQFTSLTIVPKKPTTKVTSIRVICAFEKNDNEAFFDNLCLSKEVAQTMKYNDEGELVSVQSTGTAEETARYEDGLLAEVTTGGSGTFKYDYDDTTKNLTSATNKIVTETYDYNEQGGIIGTALIPYTEDENATPEKEITSSVGYSTDGNRSETQTDSRGNSINYNYDSSTTATDKLQKAYGLPRYIEDPEENKVYYTYDANTGRTTSTYMSGIVSITNTYTNGRLTTLQRAGYNGNSRLTQKYMMGYDVFGNMTSLSVGTDSGTQTLGTYEYAANNGNLTKQTYGNGDYIEFTYDKLNRTTETETSDGDKYYYAYTGDGQLYSIEDDAGDLVYYYTYDTLGRLAGTRQKSTATGSTFDLRASYSYDNTNRIKSISYTIPGIINSATESFYYNEDSTDTISDGSIVSMAIFSNNWLRYRYDDLSRLTERDIADLLTEHRTYLAGNSEVENSTTGLTKEFYTTAKGDTETLSGFRYTYDKNGNIDIITNLKDNTAIDYDYDEQGQLTKVKWLNAGGVQTREVVYKYDTYGNIRSKYIDDSVLTLEYEDDEWRDLLTKVTLGNGVTDPVEVELDYDGSGNPLVYFNGQTYNMTWVNGRELDTVTTGGKTYSYEYDVNGLRTRKTNSDGGYTEYYIMDGLTVAERRFDSTSAEVYTMRYYFDESNAPVGIGIQYPNYADTYWDSYYFAKNLQGDIIAIYNSNNGNPNLIATYEYDAWGRPLSIRNSSGVEIDPNAYHVGLLNPFRYRGYRYDGDTGFYYLQSRYYDPVIGRFINADDASLLGANSDFASLNLFAYCGNNPVARADVGGGCWHIVIGAIVGGVVSAVTTAIQTYKETGSVDITKTLISGAVGAVGGAVAATGWCMLAQAAVTAGATLLGDAATQAYEIATEQRKEYDIGRMLQNTVVAAGSSLLGSALGEITSGIRKINGKNLIEKGMGKIAQSKANQMVGKSFSNIYKKGIALIREGTKQVHIAQGTSSVTGTILTWGVSQRFSAS